MNKRYLIVILLPMLITMLLAVPAAHAVVDCGADPAAGVDWSGCLKTNEDFTLVDLSNMIMVGTDFSGSTFNATNMSGSDLTGAIMDDLQIDESVGILGAIVAQNAVIEGLDMSNNSNIVFADFTGATGEPLLPATPPATILIVCPAGNVANYIDTFCTWTPTAVTMLGITVEPDAALLPFAAVGVLGLVSGLLIAGLQRRRETAVA